MGKESDRFMLVSNRAWTLAEVKLYLYYSKHKELTTHWTHLTHRAEVNCRSSNDLFQRGACIIYPRTGIHPQPGQPSVA